MEEENFTEIKTKVNIVNIKKKSLIQKKRAIIEKL